jgi:hypothetical protein
MIVRLTTVPIISAAAAGGGDIARVAAWAVIGINTRTTNASTISSIENIRNVLPIMLFSFTR